jgi:sterol 3beta-glucosyltransferase
LRESPSVRECNSPSASPFITNTNLGPFNRLTHKLLIDMLWKSSRDDVDAMRASLGLGRAGETFTLAAQRMKNPCALAYSEALSGRPSDYTPNNVITGNMVAPDALRARLGEAGLPAELEAWLDRGPAPVFLGFGSMPILKVPEILAMARAMLKELGLRAVIGAGWSDVPAGGDDTLIAVGHVDHPALFERCVAAVHHGGAGTTYASLRAGIPTLICSVFADQPYWGCRAKALGVGATFPFKKLNEKRLTEGVRRLIDPAVRARAEALGERMRSEDGLARVIELIERDLPRAPIPS